jgi:transposase, IS5 family
MRQRFDQQTNLGIVPIADTKFPLKSRDELPPVLMALQYIFITPELNEQVFLLLEKKVCGGKKKTGRRGMDLWHILVLAVVRHACNTNWDTLHTWANFHELVRRAMGVHSTAFMQDCKEEFEYQNILDNVSLIDEALLLEINRLVVDAGHKLVKKKDDDTLTLKTDSYVAETNIHFPTDLNLLWDSIRKCLDAAGSLGHITGIKGWRKIKNLRKNFKALFRATSHQVFKGRNEQQKKNQVRQYLQQSAALTARFDELINNPPLCPGHEDKIMLLLLSLNHYKAYAEKFMKQIERRLLKGETIAPEEKVYSIFEPHTEWITKGKLNKKVELGHLVLITSDQYHFIVHYRVMEGHKDASQIAALCPAIKRDFAGKIIKSHSFDKGFWSRNNLEILQDDYTQQAILPKKGRLSQQDKERQSDPAFKKLRHAHSAIESNINMLEHHGLNRCMDKGIKGYKRTVGLSVLAYNLHLLGNALKAIELKKAAKADTAKFSLAA